MQVCKRLCDRLIHRSRYCFSNVETIFLHNINQVRLFTSLLTAFWSDTPSSELKLLIIHSYIDIVFAELEELEEPVSIVFVESAIDDVLNLTLALPLLREDIIKYFIALEDIWYRHALGIDKGPK